MDKEIKEEKLGEAPATEVKVWGLGLMLKKLDKLIELQDRNNFLTAKSEEKLTKIIELVSENRKV